MSDPSGSCLPLMAPTPDINALPLQILLQIQREVARGNAVAENTAADLSDHVHDEMETWRGLQVNLKSLRDAIDALRQNHDDRLDQLEQRASASKMALTIGWSVIGVASTIGVAVLGAALQVSHWFSDFVTSHFG